MQDGALVIQMGDVPVTATLHEGDLIRLYFNEETQLYFTKLAE